MQADRTIVIADIKPFGNLESMLNTLDEEIKLCEAEGYTKEVARLCRLLSEFGLLAPGSWFDEMDGEDDRPEVEMVVLYSRSLLIRLNNIAQKDLNGFTMKPTAEQMMDDQDLMKHFKNVTFK